MKQKVCDVDACKGCPIRNQFPDSVFVPPRYGENLRLQIGENPGSNEAELGTPFGGTAGGWVRNIYQKAGLKESDNSALNVIQCYIPELVQEGSSTPIFPVGPEARRVISDSAGYGAVVHCQKAHVEPMLKARPWERLDVFGDIPLNWILNRRGGITNWRGSILPVPFLDNAKIAIATFHPNYIAKDQSMYPVAINDIRKTLDIEPELYNIYPSIDDVKKFTAKSFAFDIETDGWTKRISLVGFSSKDYEALVVPFVEPYISEIQRIFWDAEEVIGQNIIQFDLPVLAHNDVFIRPPKECLVWDIMLMHHLRFPVFPHGLEFIGKQFTNKGAWKADKLSFETYCARDVDVTFRCFQPLKQLLTQASLLDIYKYISWPMGKICRLMTDTGLHRSSTRILTLRNELAQQIRDTELLLPEHLRSCTVGVRKRRNAPPGTVSDKGNVVKYVYVEETKEIVPWRSAEVKKRYLYEELRDAKGKRLPEQRHIKTKQLTVDKNALDKLYTRYKLPELKALKDLNKWATLLSNFAKEEGIQNETVHPSFNVHGTEAGRLSSSGPNIQNQPQAVRYTYVPRTPGGKILSCDFSGIENRLTAFLARDRKRLAWFRDPNFSEHKYLAACIMGIPYEEVEKSKEKDSPYAMAKVIVHGSDRLMGSKKIAAQYDLDIDKVKDFQNTWKKEIADTIAWQRRVSDGAMRVGYVCNPFQRRLWLWESNSATRAVSFFPQSTAFDVIARAMIALMFERIGWPKEWAQKVAPIVEPLPEGVLLLAQVHDELLTETENANLVAPTFEVLTKVMTQPWPELNGLSLPIGTGVGDSWGDCD